MKILICGAGQIGGYAAESLCREGHDVTIIDTNDDLLNEIQESLDVAVVRGNGASAQTLQLADAGTADALLACTGSDETNILAASVASYMGTRRTMARIRHGGFLKDTPLDYRRSMSIDAFFSPAIATARAIAEQLRNPGALALEHLADGAVDIQELRVDDTAKVVGKSLAAIPLPKGARLIALRRGSNDELPGGETVVEGGDLVVIAANAGVLNTARQLFQKDPRRGCRKIALMGGSSTAVWLCRMLRDRGFDIRLLEIDRHRAEELATKLDWVTVLHSDATDPSVIEEENLGQVDAFVALADDGQNIVACAAMSRAGVPITLPVVRRQDWAAVLEQLGIVRWFDPRKQTAQRLSHLLDESPVRCMATVAGGTVDLYRGRLSDDAAICNRPLKELSLRDHCMVVVAPDQEGRPRVPGPDDVLLPATEIYLAGPPDIESRIHHLLTDRS
jgi:trk system potassium uptake protein TrkA